MKCWVWRKKGTKNKYWDELDCSYRQLSAATLYTSKVNAGWAADEDPSECELVRAEITVKE